MKALKHACFATGMLDGRMQTINTEPGEEVHGMANQEVRFVCLKL